MISISPKDQTKGGGLPDDRDYTIVDITAQEFTYPGSNTAAVGALIKFEDDEGTEYEQFYKAGDEKVIQPSEDGDGFDPVDDDKEISGFNERSKFGVFMRELKNAGFPEDTLDDADGNLKVIIGTYGHIKALELKYGGDIKDTMCPVFTKIHSLPGEKKKGKGKDKSSSKDKDSKSSKGKEKPTTKESVKGKKKDADEDEDDFESKVRDVVVEVLTEEDGPVENKTKLSSLVNKKLKDEWDDEDRMKAVKLVLKDDFINSDEAPWTVDGKEISL